MKTNTAAFILSFSLLLSACAAEEGGKVFTVTSLGPVDTQWVARVSAWAASNLALPVEAAAPLGDQIATLEDAIAKATQSRPAHQVGRIVLIKPEKDSTAHGVLRPEAGVALINVTPMQSDGADAEKVQKRLERQVIRAICMLMGLESSPNPQSAMCAYQSLEELDQIGRNLDPPWLVRLQKGALEKGIRVDPDNAFNLVN